MSFSDRLVLWLHLGFVIFTIGPVTLAIMSTPRYIRNRNVVVLRYLSRITFVFALASIGVLVAGLFLSQLRHEAGHPWVIISATLFVVTLVLLILIIRDQRQAIAALTAAADQAAHDVAASASATQRAAAGSAAEEAGAHSGAPGAPGAPGAAAAPGAAPPASTPAAPGAASPSGPERAGAATAGPATTTPGPAHLASVERGRIATMGGVVVLIWLVILVLMVWNS
jgi:hypothetical protein